MCRCFRKDRNIGGFDFNLNYTIMTHYESLKESISPQMLKTAAATLREDEKGVASAVAVLLPSLLVRFMDQGETARSMRLFAKPAMRSCSTDGRRYSPATE